MKVEKFVLIKYVSRDSLWSIVFKNWTKMNAHNKFYLEQKLQHVLHVQLQRLVLQNYVLSVNLLLLKPVTLRSNVHLQENSQQHLVNALIMLIVMEILVIAALYHLQMSRIVFVVNKFHFSAQLNLKSSSKRKMEPFNTKHYSQEFCCWYYAC